MAGTRIGGIKAAKRIKERHGKDFFVRNGMIGGKNGHAGGFASMSRERLLSVSAKGGRQKRGYRKTRYQQTDIA